MRKSLWLLLFSLGACTSDPVTPDLGLDYFPIVFGDYRIYEVSETTYVDKVATSDEYQLRESFADMVQDEGGETIYLLKIERREGEQDAWQSIETVGIRQTNQYLEYRQDNRAFIVMTYPINFCRKNDLSQLLGLNGGSCNEWDGNIQNEDIPEFHHYRKLDDGDFTFGGGDHIKLILSDFPANIVKRDNRHEIYARGIGLVERSFDQVDFCFDESCSGTNEIQDGIILLQRLIEYGSE